MTFSVAIHFWLVFVNAVFFCDLCTIDMKISQKNSLTSRSKQNGENKINELQLLIIFTGIKLLRFPVAFFIPLKKIISNHLD